jgi:hypothetical protein
VALNLNQPARILAAIGKIGQGAPHHCRLQRHQLVLADQIEAITQETGRDGLHLVRDLPAGEGSGWNDVLRADLRPRQNHTFPSFSPPVHSLI